MTTDSIRFALIGAGGIAQSYVQATENNPHAKIVSVADTRSDAAQATAERLVCPAFTDAEALLTKGPACDAVIICTPPNTHTNIARMFIERGVHTLCEKPFTLTSTDAKSLVAFAAKQGVTLSMGSKFRYAEDVVKAKSIVASGILGEIILFENAFTSRVEMGSRWNSKPEIAGGGVLIDNGTHSVDIIRYFLGPIAEVHALEGKRVQGLAVEDTVRLFVKTTSGVMGGVDLSWSINKELDSYLNIYGSLGTIQVGWRESRYRQASSKDWIVFGKGYNKVQAFRDQLVNFAKAIRKEQPLLIGPDDAVASVEVIEAAYNSLRNANWTTV